MPNVDFWRYAFWPVDFGPWCPTTRIRERSPGEPQVSGRHESIPISNNLGAGPVPTGTEARPQGTAGEAAAKSLTRSRASEAA